MARGLTVAAVAQTAPVSSSSRAAHSPSAISTIGKAFSSPVFTGADTWVVLIGAGPIRLGPHRNHRGEPMTSDLILLRAELQALIAEHTG
jgi:hypothetical protein